MRSYSIIYEFNCKASAFWKVFLGKDFNERLYLQVLGCREYSIDEERATDVDFIRAWTFMPRIGGYPAPVAEVLGANFRFTALGRLDKSSNIWHVKYTPSVHADQIRYEAVIRADSVSDDKLRLIADITMASDLPGIGGMLESALEKQVRREYVETAESLKFIVESRFTLSLVDGNIPVLPSGALENSSTSPGEKHLAARIRFGETVFDAWNERRHMSFILPDGVVFRGAEFTKFEGFSYQGKFETGVIVLNTGQRIHSASSGSLASVCILGGMMTISGLERKPYDSKKLLSMEFLVWLSIAADFMGEITLQASERPGDPRLASCSMVIAMAAPVISIETNVCRLPIGGQGQGNDILLRESHAGALSGGERVELWLGERLAAGLREDVRLASGASVAVVEGNLRIKNVVLRNGLLQFDIDRESSVPSLVRVSNLSVYVARSVPETLDDPLLLTVGGSAVAANSRYATDFENSRYEIEDPSSAGKMLSLDRELFETRGISTPFLCVTPPL